MVIVVRDSRSFQKSQRGVGIFLWKSVIVNTFGKKKFDFVFRLIIKQTL